MIKEELTKLLMEAYERGQSDIIKSCHETISIAVDTAILAEREACAKIGDDHPSWSSRMYSATIRARGQA